MNYYKRGDQVFAFSDDQMECVLDDMELMTPEEVESHLNPPSPNLTKHDIEMARLMAYADPVFGSDRYFSEATRLQAIGAQQSEIEAATAAGVARATEIAAMNPWPNE